MRYKYKWTGAYRRALKKNIEKLASSSYQSIDEIPSEDPVPLHVQGNSYSQIIIQTMGVRLDTKIKIMSKIILVLLRLGMTRYDYITVINVVVRSVKLATIFFFFYWL